MLFIDEQPSDVQLPSAVDLEVAETEPGLRGDTASGGGTKPATLETGATIQVPLFVNVGERVRVDTRSGDYACSRAPACRLSAWHRHATGAALACAAPSSGGRRCSRSTSTTSPVCRSPTRSPREPR